MDGQPRKPHVIDPVARGLLNRLLTAGDRADAGVSSRQPRLVGKQLEAYRQQTYQARQRCEVALIAARSVGAIALQRDPVDPEGGMIERIDLLDAERLADFLGGKTLKSRASSAESVLAPLVDEFPVLGEVLEKWSATKKVRRLGPDSVTDWFDAVAVVHFCQRLRSEDSIPVRDASRRLFKDSKRIEKLTGPLDILLAGSIDARPRSGREVWQEIGLHREEQPALCAGRVELKRQRVSAILDIPYAGFPPATVLGVVTRPERVISIENLTTFHTEAKRLCDEPVLLLYTAGMPSPIWRAMYVRLLASVPNEVPVFHWGDYDEGGFRIAAVLARDARQVGHQLQPWRMRPEEIPHDMRVTASAKTIERMQYFAQQAGWTEIVSAINAAGFTTEQEGFQASD